MALKKELASLKHLLKQSCSESIMNLRTGSTVSCLRERSLPGGGRVKQQRTLHWEKDKAHGRGQRAEEEEVLRSRLARDGKEQTSNTIKLWHKRRYTVLWEKRETKVEPPWAEFGGIPQNNLGVGPCKGPYKPDIKHTCNPFYFARPQVTLTYSQSQNFIQGLTSNLFTQDQYN